MNFLKGMFEEKMKYSPLGKTGLQVSEIGYGAGLIGNKPGHWGKVAADT